jgi:glucose uptake protein
MILPTTYGAALTLLIVSMLCWGSWANTQKLSGKWRFELFYYDYSIGMLLCALIAAYTLGEFAPRELTFSDNLLIAGKRQMVWAAGAGAIFNLANMLLVAAIAVSGMAVAFPIGIGLALVIGVVANFILNPQGNATLLFGGAFLVVVAILVDAFAYSGYLDQKADAEKKQALQADPRVKRRGVAKPTGAARGLILSVVSGILMGLFYPMVETARQGEAGLGPYGIALLFGAGVLVSTLFYIPFFLNFPVSGEPIQTKEYFKGTVSQHALGLLGGIVWMVGGICNFAAAGTPVSLQVGPAVSYALGQGATMVSALWGLIVWREFKGANQRVQALLILMLVLFVAGLTMISMAPLHAAR